MAEQRETGSIDKNSYWQEHISNWRTSGITQVSYCKKHDLKSPQFHYWKKKMEEAAQKSAQGGRLRLVPIVRPEQVLNIETRGFSDSGLRLNVKGISIEVATDFNQETLADIVEVLRKLKC